MKSWQRLSAIFFLAISAVVLQQAIWVQRVMDHGQPGSGFMPLLLGIVMAFLSILLFVTNRGRDAKRVPFWEPRSWLYPAIALAITALFIVVFDDIGAITSVVVLVTGWVWFVGKKSIVVAAVTGVLTGGAVYLVFDRLLQAPVPRGLLF